LAQCDNDFLKGFAEKSIKEVRYHVQHSADWVKRLGDGTEESHTRMQNAINEIWSYTGELFLAADFEQDLGFVNYDRVKEQWTRLVSDVFAEATLEVPADQWMQKGGKTGRHTEHLGFILAEMQYLPRAYPGAKW
jgi:ring-1,2-phenylacetyl-CoA epoxidase subunit PaaC